MDWLCSTNNTYSDSWGKYELSCKYFDMSLKLIDSLSNVVNEAFNKRKDAISDLMTLDRINLRYINEEEILKQIGITENEAFLHQIGTNLRRQEIETLIGLAKSNAAQKAFQIAVDKLRLASLSAGLNYCP